MFVGYHIIGTNLTKIDFNIRIQLEKTPVSQNDVYIVDICAFTHKCNSFSHPRTGRNISIMVLSPVLLLLMWSISFVTLVVLHTLVKYWDSYVLASANITVIEPDICVVLEQLILDK